MTDSTIATPAAASGHAHLSTRILALASMGLMVLDPDLRWCGTSGWPVSGLSASRVLGRPLFEVFPELAGQRLEQLVHSAMQSKLPQRLSPASQRAPFPLYASGTWGGERIDQAVAITLFTEGKQHYCLIEVSDISITVDKEKQLRGQAEALRAQSYVDGLTGIANRRHFDVALDRELRRAQRNSASCRCC
jgi:hypothetical protein